MSEFKEIHVGSHIKLTSGFPFASANFANEGFPLIRIRDVLTSRTETYFQGYFPPGYIINRGNILVGMDGDFHVVRWRGCDALLNQRVLKIDVLDESVVVLDYLYHWLGPFIKKINDVTAATTVKHLSTKDLTKAKAKFPSVATQRRIAAILTNIDSAIEKTEALIAKYQQIKAGLMHDLFTRGITADGKLRPPREQAPELYQETLIGWIPKEWEVLQLRDLGDVVTGNTPPEHTFSDNGRGIPFVTPGDVGNAVFVSETVRSVTPGLAGMARLITPNATCVVCIGSTIGKLALVSRESITNQQINSVLCQKQELSFLVYFSMSYFLPSQLRREAGLQAVPIVKKSVFEKLLVARPISSKEAMEVQNKLLGIAAQLEAEEAVACKLRQQKLGLMHDLLTGKVRVNPNAAHLTDRGELVEPPATQPEPFDKLRANGV